DLLRLPGRFDLGINDLPQGLFANAFPGPCPERRKKQEKHGQGSETCHFGLLAKDEDDSRSLRRLRWGDGSIVTTRYGPVNRFPTATTFPSLPRMPPAQACEA